MAFFSMQPIKKGFNKSTKNFGKNIGKGFSNFENNNEGGNDLFSLLKQGTNSIKPIAKDGLSRTFNILKKPFVFAWNESGIKDKVVNAYEEHIKPWGFTADPAKDAFSKAVDNLNVPFLSSSDVQNGIDLEKLKTFKSLLTSSNLASMDPKQYIPANFDAMKMAEEHGVDTSSVKKFSMDKPNPMDIVNGKVTELKIKDLPKELEQAKLNIIDIKSTGATLSKSLNNTNSIVNPNDILNTTGIENSFKSTSDKNSRLFNNPFGGVPMSFKNIIDPEKMSYIESIDKGLNSKVVNPEKISKYAVRPGNEFAPNLKMPDYLYSDMPHINIMFGNDNWNSPRDINRYTIFDYDTESVIDRMNAQLHSFDDPSALLPDFKVMEQTDIFGQLDNSKMFFGYLEEGSELMRNDASLMKDVVDTKKNIFMSESYLPLREVRKIDTSDFKLIVNSVKKGMARLFHL